VAREPVVLKPHTGVGVPVVSWYFGQSPKMRGEVRVTDASAKSPRNPLVWDQLRSQSSSLSWHHLRPRSSLWRERLSLLSMVCRTSW
jgi:hypothetical protein